MASIRLKFRASSVSGREGTLLYQIIHQRTVRYVKTGYTLHSAQWDNAKGTIVIRGNDPTAAYLLHVREQTAKLMGRAAAQFDAVCKARPDCPMSELIEHSGLCEMGAQGFCAFAGKQMERLLRLGFVGTAKTYASARASFLGFLRLSGREDIKPLQITADLMEQYEAYLRARGVTRNSSSFYMRTLRTLYNKAAECDKSATGKKPWGGKNVFSNVYTGFDLTRKRAVSLEELRKIKALDLGEGSSAALARDLFLFSFYTRGMSFVDMAFLRKGDIVSGELLYVRKKTGGRFAVQWRHEMQAIVDRYAKQTSGTPYLLPIITICNGRERCQYESALHRTNRHLKRIGAMAGLAAPLTMYVARHTWATIARKINVPLSVISFSMGHSSEKTTQVYLDSIDAVAADRANSRILSKL